MQLGRQIAFALSIILFVLPLAGAFTAATDVSTIQMTSCSRGQVYAYAENPESTDATLSVVAYFGKLYGNVECPIQSLPAYRSSGTKIDVHSGCFMGDEDVVIYFNICNNATLNSCTTIRKTVRVTAEPCTCSNYVEQHLPPVDNYVPAKSTCVGASCGQPLYSNINFASSFEPSVSVDVAFARESYSLVAGTNLQTDVIVTNTGSPATIDLSLKGDVSELGASLQESTVGIGSSESKSVALSISPSASESGQNCLDVVATSRGRELDSRTMCFDVFEFAGATVSAPASAGSGTCGTDVTYPVKVENTGAFTNTFTFTSDNDAVRVTPSRVTIPAGESASATATINASRLGFAQDVGVTVTGSRVSGTGNDAFSQTVVTSIRASECETKNTVSSDTRTFTVIETFRNPSNGTIYGVTGTIEGLPSGFVVSQVEGMQDVAPGASINITLSVTAPSNAPGEAAGVLVLRSQDNKILRQRPIVLNTVRGGITGFFTKTVGSSLSYIIALLIGAAIVALFYSRADRKNESGTVKPAASNKKDAVAANSKESDADKDAGDSATITNS